MPYTFKEQLDHSLVRLKENVTRALLRISPILYAEILRYVDKINDD